MSGPERPRYASFATDSSNQLTGLLGDDRTIVEVGPDRSSPITRKSSRIVRAGLNIFAFTDHTSFTTSGAESSSYTLSTVSGYNGIAAGDTPEGVAQGSKTGSSAMMKLVCDGSQAGSANYFVISASNLNLTTGDERFGLWVYFSTDIATNSTWIQPTIAINVSTANTFNGDAADYTFSFNGNQIRQGWNFLVFKCDASAHPYGVSKSGIGSNSFATNGLKKFRIYMTVTAGKTLTCYFDTLWSNFSTTPAVVMGLDDTGSSSLPAYSVPILDSYGIKGYVALIAESTDDTTRLTGGNFNTSMSGSQLSNIQSAYDAGWDIINHCLKHANTSNDGSARTQLLTDGQLAYQVLSQTAWQLAHGWDRGKEFYAAPQGRWDSTTIRRLTEWGFKLARMQQHTNNTRTVFGYDQPMNMGWISLDSPVSGSANYANWKTFIDAVIDYGGDAILGWHQVITGGNADGSSTTGNSLQIYDSGLRVLCAYLKSLHDAGTIKLMSMSELYYNGTTPLR